MNAPPAGSDWISVEQNGVDVRYKGDPLGHPNNFTLQTERFDGTDSRVWRDVRNGNWRLMFWLGYRAAHDAMARRQ